MALAKEVLTENEVMAMVARCGRGMMAARNRAMLVFLWRTGVRVHELLALRTIDVSEERREATLQTTKGSKVRTIPLDDLALDYVRAWREMRRVLGIRSRTMFCTRVGRPMHPQQLRNWLKRIAVRAGITKRVHPHAFRRTFAIELDRERAPLGVIMELLGHSKVSTTTTYIRRHGSDEARRVIASRRS